MSLSHPVTGLSHIAERRAVPDGTGTLQRRRGEGRAQTRPALGKGSAREQSVALSEINTASATLVAQGETLGGVLS
jgi:hypothetical protein